MEPIQSPRSTSTPEGHRGQGAADGCAGKLVRSRQNHHPLAIWGHSLCAPVPPRTLPMVAFDDLQQSVNAPERPRSKHERTANRIAGPITHRQRAGTAWPTGVRSTCRSPGANRIQYAVSRSVSCFPEKIGDRPRFRPIAAGVSNSMQHGLQPRYNTAIHNKARH